jgi:hypothetical protein
MKADNLTAKIERVSTATLSPGPGAFGLGRARAHGTFIIVSLAVTSSDINPTGPQGDAFYEEKDGNVELLAGRATLWPSGRAENADYHSFLNGKYVKPGDTVTGDVIFDVPTDEVQEIIRNDAIAVSGFGLSIGSGAFGLLKLS